MQKPTSVQLDETVEELVNEKMESTVPKEVRNILAGSIKTDAFKSRKFPEKYFKKAKNNETQHGGGFGKQGRRWKLKKNSENASAVNNTSSVIASGAENTAEEKNAEIAPITITILVSQQIANPASTPQNAPPPFRSGNRGRGRGCFLVKVEDMEIILDLVPDVALLNTPVSLMLIVWMLHL